MLKIWGGIITNTNCEHSRTDLRWPRIDVMKMSFSPAGANRAIACPNSNIQQDPQWWTDRTVLSIWTGNYQNRNQLLY